MSQDQRTDADEGQGTDQAEKIAQKLAEWERFRERMSKIEMGWRYLSNRYTDQGNYEAAVWVIERANELRFCIARMPPPL